MFCPEVQLSLSMCLYGSINLFCISAETLQWQNLTLSFKINSFPLLLLLVCVSLAVMDFFFLAF